MITVTHEPLVNSWDTFEGMASAAVDEVYPSGPPEINQELYFRLDNAGVLRYYPIRDTASGIIGCFTFLLTMALKQKSKCYAFCDLQYLLPLWRRKGLYPIALSMAEDDLKEFGVTNIVLGFRTDHSHFPPSAYKHIEHVFEKSL